MIDGATCMCMSELYIVWEIMEYHVGYGYTYWEMPLHKRGVCVNELVYPVYLLI